MNDWPEAKLGDHVELITGFPFQSARYTQNPSDVRLLSGYNILQGELRWDRFNRWPISRLDGMDSYRLSVDDVVLAMDRPWIDAGLKFAWIRSDDVPSLLVQRTARLRGTESLDTKFLRYLVGSPGFTEHIQAVTTGTAVPHISPDGIKSFRFRLPPHSVQRRIAEILGRLDDKIEVNRRINRTLERMAQALYKHWFVDFGPFRDGEFVESEVGLAPRGWEVKALSDIVDLLSGGTPKTSVVEYWDGDIDWVSAKDVATSAPFIMSTERKITRKGIDNSATKILPAFTTVITARGTVGQCGLLPWGMAMNQTSYGLRGKGKVGDFTTYLVVQDAVERLRQHAYGTVFDTITRKTFEAIRVIVPPEPILIRFEQTIDIWFREMLVNQKQNIELAATRDYLLPRLLAGEVEV